MFDYQQYWEYIKAERQLILEKKSTLSRVGRDNVIKIYDAAMKDKK